jgi:hypothetical protein
MGGILLVDPGLFEYCTPRQGEVLRAIVAAKGNGRVASKALGVHGSIPSETLKAVQKKAALQGFVAGAPPAAVPREPEEPLAARQERRLRDEIARLKREADQANRELNEAEDLRAAVFGLGKPIDPAQHRIDLKPRKGEATEAALLFQSDEQWGEVIDLEEMGGINAYNRHIAEARYRRLIESAIRCCLPPNAAAPPPVFYYCMGGDSLSGSIHEELAETNDLSSIPAVMDYCRNISWGIRQLRAALGCPIVVVRVPGNHDRTTIKRRAKGYNRTSFDTIISWHLEMMFAEEEDVTFLIPKETDAYFDVLGWKFLLTHGDNMGTGGGSGYIGAAAPITKGHRRLVETAQQSGKPVDYVLTGHFHTALETEYGWANGSLPGFGEYAKLLRFKPSPPVQWLLHVHPDRGVTTRRQIMVAAPGEGSLYERGPRSSSQPVARKGMA